MNPYLPVLMFLVFGVTIGLILSAISYFVGPQGKKNSIKSEPYECGVPMAGVAQEKFSVKFYLTAILFILFDIETVFLYVWARTFGELGWFGVVEIFVFLVILLAGYIYVLRRGALEWN